MFLLQALGFLLTNAEHFWRGRRWGHVDGIRPDLDRSVLQRFLFGSWATSICSEV